MNEEREAAILEMLEHAMNADDSFTFRCTVCGKCCKNREDIMMSPFDIYRAAKHLGRNPNEIAERYCIWFVGENSMLPVITIRMQGPEKVCPFLQQKKCIIHGAKPTVCALFPLGRITSENGDVQYIIQNVNCGERDKEQTVREWMTGYDLAEAEAWASEWGAAVADFSRRIHEFANTMKQETIQMIEQTALILLYLKYDTDRDFMEQFRANAALLNTLLSVGMGTQP